MSENVERKIIATRRLTVQVNQYDDYLFVCFGGHIVSYLRGISEPSLSFDIDVPFGCTELYFVGVNTGGPAAIKCTLTAEDGTTHVHSDFDQDDNRTLGKGCYLVVNLNP
jgi:hypothetical protein